MSRTFEKLEDFEQLETSVKKLAEYFDEVSND
jgi:hypothetical protein